MLHIEQRLEVALHGRIEIGPGRIVTRLPAVNRSRRSYDREDVLDGADDASGTGTAPASIWRAGRVIRVHVSVTDDVPVGIAAGKSGSAVSKEVSSRSVVFSRSD